MNREIRSLKLIYCLFLIGISLILFVSWHWNYEKDKNVKLEYAKTEALASYNKDLLYRRWASLHGGLYVPITPNTQPNPHLLFIVDRDIEGNNGKIYTLINPAYMTRQVHQLAEEQYGVKGHITSLNPIRKQNMPDEWEKKALQLFENGTKEYYSIEKKDSSNYLRYMQAMVTEKNCLKCHAHQGYKLGDIRGGISVAVPMEKYDTILAAKVKSSSISHSIVFLIILALSFLGYKKLRAEMKTRDEVQKKLMANEVTLQQKNLEYKRLNEEYKKQNKELLLAKNQADESNNLKTAFIQNISHEIRTPMNSIIGFSELIDNPSLSSEKRHKFTNIIIKSTQQLLSIVNNILIISALDKKQENTTIELVCINSLMDDLAAVFMQNITNPDVKLIKQAGLPDSESEILTDKTKLVQILTNLISNALKFTEKGCVEFGYSLNKDFLEFYVKDTGIGIKKEYLLIIFERFRQANFTIGKKYGGNGLGLAISKEFAEMLGGKIWAESKFGEGSTFRFTIPYKKTH